MLVYQTMQQLVQLKCDGQPSVEKYTIAFRDCISRLEGLNAQMAYLHIIIHFVMGAEKSFPVWAERQRHETLGSVTLDTPASVLEDLIPDLLDADRTRNNKTAKPSGSALIKGKGGKGGNGKKKCRHCHQEDPRHSEKDCLAVNAEKRKEWEDKTGKKWIPYDQYIKKKSEGKDKKPRKGRKLEDSDNNDKPIYSLIA